MEASEMPFLASYSKGSFHLTTCSGMVLLVSIAAPSLQTAWVGGGLGGNAEFCVFQGVPGWSTLVQETYVTGSPSGFGVFSWGILSTYVACIHTTLFPSL